MNIGPWSVWELQQITFGLCESFGLEQVGVLKGDRDAEGWLWLSKYKENAGKEKHYNGGGREVEGAVTEKEKSQLNNIPFPILASPH